jgi:hypothetical protein
MSGNGDYPSQIHDLPKSSQLSVRLLELNDLVDRIHVARKNINKIIREIDESLAGVHEWMASEKAKTLFKWPL